MTMIERRSLDRTDNGRTVQRLFVAVVECNLHHVPYMLRRVIETGAWRERMWMSRPWKFETFSDFITKSLPEGGMGWKPELVEGLLLKAGDDDVLVMWREMMTPQHGGDRRSEDAPIKTDNVSLEPKHGTSRAYTLTRLKHDRPDLYGRVKARGLSANAAAIEAGWRKKPDALERLRRAWRHASAEERAAFLREVTP
jgi:hypothetical protein